MTVTARESETVDWVNPSDTFEAFDLNHLRWQLTLRTITSDLVTLRTVKILQFWNEKFQRERLKLFLEYYTGSLMATVRKIIQTELKKANFIVYEIRDNRRSSI